MNIQPTPSSALSSIAGTQRAAAKAADNDAQAAAAGAQQRAEKPGGIENGISQVEKDAAAGDSGADGRQQYEQREGAAKQDREEPPASQRRSVSDKDSGTHLDLDA